MVDFFHEKARSIGETHLDVDSIWVSLSFNLVLGLRWCLLLLVGHSQGLN